MGTSNLSTRIEGFRYKNVTIDCDSKLEAAAVIYLVDHLGADSVERCHSIINYYDQDGGHHRFLPDFYIRIGNDRFIAEVKQVYRKASSINNYNRFFAEKRQALNEFANCKKMSSLWIDFDTAAELKKIYKDFLRGAIVYPHIG